VKTPVVAPRPSPWRRKELLQRTKKQLRLQLHWQCRRQFSSTLGKGSRWKLRGSGISGIPVVIASYFFEPDAEQAAKICD
jgi:hypothetical protein